MSIVFQLGNATITKDIVFGWMVERDERFFAIKTMDEVSLRELATATFPAYLDEFKAACNVQLELLLKEKEKKAKLDAEMLLKKQERHQQLKEHLLQGIDERLSAAKALAVEIADSLAAGETASLKGEDGRIYARVTRSSEEFINDFKVTGGSKEFYADSILDAAFGIMKAWW